MPHRARPHPTPLFAAALATLACLTQPATAATLTGVYQRSAAANCSIAVGTCKVTLPAVPANSALAVEQVSCSLSLNFSNFVTSPIQFTSLVFADQNGGARSYLTPTLIGLRTNGSNGSGQVSGVWSYTVAGPVGGYIAPHDNPTVTIALNDIYAGNVLSTTLVCSVIGRLITP